MRLFLMSTIYYIKSRRFIPTQADPNHRFASHRFPSRKSRRTVTGVASERYSIGESLATFLKPI